MPQLFSLTAALFMGGSLIAALVSGSLWPLICAVVALRYLTKVFHACEQATPKVDPNEILYHKGRKDWRMPS